MRSDARVFLAIALVAAISAAASAQQNEQVFIRGENAGAPAPVRPPARPAQPPPPANTIVDYPRVFDSMQETKDQRQLMETQRNFVRAEDTRRAGQFGDIVSERNQLKPDSPEAAKLQEELDRLKRDREQFAAVQRAQMDRQHKEHMARLFRKMEAAIAEVAKKHDIALPPDNNPPIPEDLSSVTPDQLRRIVMKRWIPKPDGGADLSDEVIALLNERYAAEVRPPATAPAR